MRAKLLQLCLTPCDSIYRSPHYSALKRKAVLSHAIPLRTVELSEIIIQVKWSVPEKTNTMWFRFHVVSRVVKLMETEAKHGHCLDWGKRNWELLLNGPSFVAVTQSLSRVQSFATARTAVHQASLSNTIFWSLLKLHWVHWVDDAIHPSHPLLPSFSCPQSFPASRSFPTS